MVELFKKYLTQNQKESVVLEGRDRVGKMARTKI
jgi:hypothetical protein